jgi:RNA-directed DNA polymerase
MLSNLSMRELDDTLMALGNKFGLYYTRYSDDLTFSTRNSEYSRTRATKLIREIRGHLLAAGLRLNGGKTTIVPPGSAPALPKEFRSILRQHLHYLERFGPIEHANARNFDTVSGMRRHIRGLIDFAGMVDRLYGQELLARFDKISWP